MALGLAQSPKCERPDLRGPPRARSGRAGALRVALSLAAASPRIAEASVRPGGVTLATERDELRRPTRQRLPFCPGDEHSGAADEQVSSAVSQNARACKQKRSSVDVVDETGASGARQRHGPPNETACSFHLKLVPSKRAGYRSPTVGGVEASTHVAAGPERTRCAQARLPGFRWRDDSDSLVGLRLVQPRERVGATAGEHHGVRAGATDDGTFPYTESQPTAPVNWAGRQEEARRPCFAAPASGGRARPQVHRAHSAGLHELERGTVPPAHRGGTILAGAVTTTPPARAPARGDARRRSWSSSRSRPPRRWGRSPPSRCLLGPARGESAEAASPLLGGERAHDAPRPPSGRRLDCDERAKASGERRGPARRP